MPFPARYKGTCATCHNPINVGDLITWSRRHRGRVWHGTCADPTGEGTPTPSPTPKVEPESKPDAPEAPERTPAAPGSIDALIDARIDERLAGFEPSAAIDETKVRAIAAEALDSRVRTAIDKSRLVTIKVERKDAPDVEVTGAHVQMPDLLYWLGKGKHVILTGAPGAGKSHAVVQAAEALGRGVYVESLAPTDTRSLLIGFKGPDGAYHRTRFRDAVEHGGVLVLEEGDNTASSLLVTLNVLLANGHISFPDTSIKVHADFVCAVLMNTSGRGGDVLYPERRPIDVAFLNRFVVIEWKTDNELERRIALAYNPDAGRFIEWCQSLRTWARDNRKRLLVTPRQTFTFCEALADGRPLSSLVDQVILCTADPDLRREALAAFPVPK